jgi:uncharacterized membrane protein YqjE
METAFVFPYFLASLLVRIGICGAVAERIAIVLSAAGLVALVFAPFHPRLRIKLTMLGVAWMVVMLAAAGCIWDCEDALQNGARAKAGSTRDQSIMVAEF